MATRPRLGLALSLTAAALWGSLPIALRPVVAVVDPVTVTWTRYVVAAIGLGVLLSKQGRWPMREDFRGWSGIFLFICLAGFAGNNFAYLLGLKLTSPSAAQIVLQLAPLLVIFGAVRLFGEHFGGKQWLGIGVLVVGVLTFFHQRLSGFGSAGDGYGLGIASLLAAAVMWASYALAQKRLLRQMSSVAVMWVVYAAGSVLMLPAASIDTLAKLDGARWAFLGFCCLNSVVSYGAFSEALAVWQASRVSAIVALAPLFTVFFTYIAAAIWPQYIASEALDGLNLAGAGLVVTGCILMARRDPIPPVSEE